VLEYCSVDKLIQREQYYLDILNPHYNICSNAGSTLGKLHSAEAKDKISSTKKGTGLGEANSFFGKTHLEESRKKMVEAKLGRTLSELAIEKISAASLGRKFTEEHKSRLSDAQPNRKNISVFDLETGIEIIYGSIAEAERSMEFPKDSIRANLRAKNKSPYKGRYNIKVIE
jgi:group I intron endonuclease